MQKYCWKILLDFFWPNRTNAIGFGSSNDDKANFNMIFAQQKMKYDMYVQASKKAFLKMCKTSESNILVTNMIWQMQSVLAPPHLLLLKRKSERCDNASQGTFDFNFSRSETKKKVNDVSVILFYDRIINPVCLDMWKQENAHL